MYVAFQDMFYLNMFRGGSALSGDFLFLATDTSINYPLLAS